MTFSLNVCFVDLQAAQGDAPSSAAKPDQPRINTAAVAAWIEGLHLRVSAAGLTLQSVVKRLEAVQGSMGAYEATIRAQVVKDGDASSTVDNAVKP